MTRESRASILVVGDMCLDMDVYVGREGVAKKIEIAAGGSGGNVAYRLDELGVRVGLATPVSHDPAGQMLESLVKRDHPGLELHELGLGHQKTCVGMNIIGSSGARRPYYVTNLPIISLQNVLSNARKFKWVHISGYIMELVDTSALHQFVGKLKSEKINVSLDLYPRVKRATLHGDTMKLLNKLDVLFGTLNEFERLTGSSRIRTIAQRFTSGVNLVIKRGGEGATVVTREGLLSSKPPKVRPVSLKGAGDAFVAAYLKSITTGHSVTTALRTANLIASSHVAGRIK